MATTAQILTPDTPLAQGLTHADKIARLRECIADADAIVVGGASGMSAASGFRFYYMDDAVFRSVAGTLADKYGFRSMFDGLYERRMSRGEWWALILRTIKYVYECETGETYSDLVDVLQGKDYYVVTTNQDAQFFRVCPANRITRLQGDWRYFQCRGRCHDAIYLNTAECPTRKRGGEQRSGERQRARYGHLPA